MGPRARRHQIEAETSPKSSGTRCARAKADHVAIVTDPQDRFLGWTCMREVYALSFSGRLRDRRGPVDVAVEDLAGHDGTATQPANRGSWQPLDSRGRRLRIGCRAGLRRRESGAAAALAMEVTKRISSFRAAEHDAGHLLDRHFDHHVRLGRADRSGRACRHRRARSRRSLRHRRLNHQQRRRATCRA